MARIREAQRTPKEEADGIEISQSPLASPLKPVPTFEELDRKIRAEFFSDSPHSKLMTKEKLISKFKNELLKKREWTESLLGSSGSIERKKIIQEELQSLMGTKGKNKEKESPNKRIKSESNEINLGNSPIVGNVVF